MQNNLGSDAIGEILCFYLFVFVDPAREFVPVNQTVTWLYNQRPKARNIH